MNSIEFLYDYTYPWLTVTLTGAAAIALALIGHTALFGVLRRVGRPSIIFSTILEYVLTPSRLVLPLLAMQFVLASAPTDLHLRTITAQACTIMLICTMTWTVMRVVAGIGEGVVRLHPATDSDNLHARGIQTQTRVLTRTVKLFVLVVGAASVMMTLPELRQVGASLLASAGVAGLVAGIAARPVLGNLIAGLQIALTQPIRLDDVVIIENEWGRIEEITATYVVVRIWDERRLVVPLEWVIQNPFQNWTRTDSQLLGTVFLWLDYRLPLAPLRTELERICKSAPEWDGRVALLQVTDTSERAIQIRALVSAEDASKAWDLRCRVREALIDFVQREHSAALPRIRAEVETSEGCDTSAPRSHPTARGSAVDPNAITQPQTEALAGVRDPRSR